MMKNNIFKIKLIKKRKGSATLEAAMIFPLIMLMIFGIVYLTIVHYQNNVMIAESLRAMNRSGAYWQYIDMDKYGKKIEYDENNIPSAFDNTIPAEGIINTNMIKKRNAYRTIIDLAQVAISKVSGEPFGLKKENARHYVRSRLANVKFKKYTSYDLTDDENETNKKEYTTTVGDVENDGFMLFGDDLKIKINTSYNNPLSGLANSILGENNTFDKLSEKDVTISSVISNQAEFIRNVDTMYDLTSDLYSFIKNK